MRWKRLIRTILIALLTVIVGLAVTVVLFLRLPWITAETVSFQNGDVTLVGTLAIPRWIDGPYPAAIIVHGSGSFSRWLGWFNARQLVPHGMAVLMYDKRGVGDSSGVNPQEILMGKIDLKDIGNPSAPRVKVNITACGEMIEILASDALAGVEWLKNRSDIEREKIGLIGVSQAGWIMPLAASQTNAIAYIVSISGPAVTCGIENRYSELTGEMPGFQNLELSEYEMNQQLSEYDGPVGYDPVPVLTTLRTPSLWLLGGRDESVPTFLSVKNLEQIISDGAPIEIKIYPEGDHGLRRSNSEGRNEIWRYKYWAERYDYWSDVRAWLSAQDMLTQP